MDYVLIAISLLTLTMIFLTYKHIKNASNNGNAELLLKMDEHEKKLFEVTRKIDELSSRLSDEFSRNRTESNTSSEALSRRLASELLTNREESSKALKEINEKIVQIGQMNNENIGSLNKVLANSVERLQESNEKKLDQMRQTVDEKLTNTLTTRLDSSFKVVGEQLNQVHKSLGEMKELAGGVSDLQRVLTNVKTRGTWAEVQLSNILNEILTSDQFSENVSTKNDGSFVEFAVKIPSRDDSSEFVWLPIDSKFPLEDYDRLTDAAEKADKDGVELASRALEKRVKEQANTIAKTYINVPNTTDFAILFLPTEGLYAEVLRRPGLAEEIQQKYRVLICGPTTITAFLSTLRMGFKTIALDKRAAEVWKVLGAAKTQYDNFEDILVKVKKKIDEAGNTLDQAQKRNGIIKKKLKSVEGIDQIESDELLGLDVAD